MVRALGFLTTWLAVAVVACPAALAGGRPDVTVASLSARPAQVAPGGAFTVKAVVRNRGGARARRSHVAFYLSRDRRAGRGDRRLGRPVRLRTLPARKRGRVRRRVRVPAATPRGRYRLIACADARRRVRERRERNNCRAAKRRLRIRGQAPFPGGSGPLLPSLGGGGTPGGGGAPGGAGAPGGGTPGGGGAPGGEAPVPVPSSFPAPADPLAVDPQLQSGNAESARIDSAGGTLEATAQNGTVFTLTIPAGALAGPADITMTPVGSISGLPLSKGLIGAVEITPHGITLLEPATLTIDPPAEAPVAEQTAFLYHQGGEDFHLHPLGPERRLTIRLTHFSTPGVGAGTDADRAAILSRMPQRTQAQYEQLTGEVLRRARERALEGIEDTGLPVEFQQLALGYYRDVVRPIMQQAETDDGLAEQALAVGLGWARMLALLGLDDEPLYADLVEEVWDSVVKILRNAVNQASDRCVNDHELEEIHRLIGLERAAQLLGLDLGQPFDKALACARFELDMESRMVTRTPPSDGYVLHTRIVDLEIDILEDVNQAPLTWVEFSGETSGSDFAGCLPDGEDTGWTQRALSSEDSVASADLFLDINPRADGAPPPPADLGASLRLDTGSPSETYEYLLDPPGGCDSRVEIEAGTWDMFWGILMPGVTKAGSVATVTQWERGTGALLLRKTFSGSYGDVTEQTSLELWHRPAP